MVVVVVKTRSGEGVTYSIQRQYAEAIHRPVERPGHALRDICPYLFLLRPFLAKIGPGHLSTEITSHNILQSAAEYGSTTDNMNLMKIFRPHSQQGGDGACA